MQRSMTTCNDGVNQFALLLQRIRMADETDVLSGQDNGHAFAKLGETVGLDP
jgi:hypothetical protein